MNRYFIVHNRESASEFGWIYTTIEGRETDFGDFYELENELTPEGIVTLPKEDVLEIFEEEYNMISRYYAEDWDTSDLIRNVIENHLKTQETQVQKDMYRKVTWTITLIGEKLLVDHFVEKSLETRSINGVVKTEELYLSNYNNNPQIYLKVLMDSYAKEIPDLLSALESQREIKKVHEHAIQREV